MPALDDAHALALFEAGAVGFAQTELYTGRMVRVNRKFCEFTGYSQSELLQKRHLDLALPEERPALERALRERLQTLQQRIGVERRYLRPDGKVVWGRINSTLVFDGAGRCIGSAAMVEDITAEHAAHQRARRDERRLARVLEIPSIAFVEREPLSGRFTRVNSAFCRMLGYSEAALLSMTIDDVTPSNDRAAVNARTAKLASGELAEFTAMKALQRADGGLCWVLGTVSLLRGEDGDPDRLLTLYVDVTEIVAARSQLDASEERYRKLVDMMPDAVAIVSPSGETLFVNRAIEALLDHPCQYWLDGGQFAVSCALDESGVEFQRAFWAHYEADGVFLETPIEMAWLRRDGRSIALDQRFANLRNDRGEVTGLLIVLRDVTEERLARIDRERTAAIVEASEDAIFSVSRTQVIESWNSGCARQFELRARLALGRPLQKVFAEPARSGLAAMIARTVAGETVRNVDWPVADSKQPLCVVSMRRIHASDGSVRSVAVIVRDVSAERAATTALDAERAFMRTVLDTLPLAVSVRDALGRIVLANRRFDELFAGDKASSLGSTYHDRIGDPAMIDLVMRADLEVLRTGEPVTYERRVTRPGIGTMQLHSLKVPIRFADDVQVLTVASDVTAAREAELTLRREREFMRTVIDTDPTLIYVKDAQGRFLLANRALAAMIGRPVDQIEGKRLAELLADPADDAQYGARDAEVLRVRRPVSSEEFYRDVSGAERWFNSTRLPLPGADGDYVVLGVCTDITEARRQARRIHELTNFDPLTGLPNRVRIEDRLQRALAVAERDDKKVAVMFVDLDHFKTVNDSLGHPIGDRLLVAVAARMRSVLREADSIGRLGGDEFLVVLPGVDDAGAADVVAHKVLHALDEPFEIQGHSLNANASIGIAMYPDDGTTPHLLIQNSDAAMYHAKEEGRADVRYFTRALNVRAARSLAIEHGIRRALREGGFELWYQPVFATAGGGVAAMEALIRWRRDSGELWGPGEFIGVAEERGLIEPLGRWVLQEACAFLARRRAAGLREVPVAINLSPIQLRRPGLVELIRTALAQHALPPSALEIEVTESSLMHDIAAAITVLQELRTLGVIVAVDDFGTGHSSLAWLRQLPIDKLKIDRAFVANIPSNEVDSAILAAIVQMARALGIRTVAEGVETEDQLAHIRDAGCDLVQGFLLARPLAEEAVSRIVDLPAARSPAN
ncbi:MAG: PAS domain S-box protein [Proteobacteria bacterium]|nr:PAS domain S-box protein [Burkholderiales bacterium]